MDEAPSIGGDSSEPVPISIIGPTGRNEAEENVSDPIPISLVGAIDLKGVVVDVETELIIAEPTTYTVKIEIINEKEDVEDDATDNDDNLFLDEPRTSIDDEVEVTIPQDNSSSAIYLTSKGNTSKLKRSIECSKCPKHFYKQVYLDAHMRGFHMGIKKSFLCSKCPKSFTTYNMLCIHTEGHHSKVENDDTSNSIINLGLEHNYAQTANTPLQATPCSKSYKRHKQASVRKTTHRSKVENEENNNKVANLDTHAQSADQVHIIRFQCSHCPKSYAHYSLLRLHKQRRHSNVETPPRRKATDGHMQYSRFVERNPNNEHRCPVCLGKFRTGNYLRKHMRRHANDIDKFRCIECDKNFRAQSGLTRHIKVVHEGEKRFACSHCDRRFSTRQTRLFHERRHTGDRPYICEICQKSYVEKQSLRNHMIRHETLSLRMKKKCSTQKSVRKIFEISNKTNI